MLGEIRDVASADTAIKASETGHLLMSTIHSIDAISSINRLEGMEVSRQQISGVLTAVLAQRLVKRIDDDADISWVNPSDVEIAWLKRNGIYFEGIKFPKVDPLKMNGRIPLMELIEINSEIRDLIAQPGDRTAKLLELVSKQPQFETLAECGVKLALAGQTTLAEVMHVTRDNQSLSVNKRFEQIMIERGWLTVHRLDEAWRILIDYKDQGVVYSLDRVLIENGFATEHDVAVAIDLANSANRPPATADFRKQSLAIHSTDLDGSMSAGRLSLPPDRTSEALVA
jgi:general secretion pathway protein E